MWQPDWRRPPPDGTPVCGGFDGSDTDDWTALRLETISGYRFTPRYGEDERPTIWNPHEWGNKVPRMEVAAAVGEVFDRFRVQRLYCDPPDWRTEIDEWVQRYGDEHVIEWPTYRGVPMHAALERFVSDIQVPDRSPHDGCPLTRQAAMNARRLSRPGQRYLLGKPAQHQKIDPLMADVLAHEAAADARTAGWTTARPEHKVFVFRR